MIEAALTRHEPMQGRSTHTLTHHAHWLGGAELEQVDERRQSRGSEAGTHLVPVSNGGVRARAVVVRRAWGGRRRRRGGSGGFVALGRRRLQLGRRRHVRLGLVRVGGGAAADERRGEAARVPVIEVVVVAVVLVAAPPEAFLDPPREAPGDAGDPGERAWAGAGEGGGEERERERGRRPRGRAPPEQLLGGRGLGLTTSYRAPSHRDVHAAC